MEEDISLNCAELCWGNRKIYLHLLSFLKTEMVQAIEIFPHGRQRSLYFAWSIAGLLIIWRCKESGYQPWYWTCYAAVFRFQPHKGSLFGNGRSQCQISACMNHWWVTLMAVHCIRLEMSGNKLQLFLLWFRINNGMKSVMHHPLMLSIQLTHCPWKKHVADILNWDFFDKNILTSSMI